MMEKIQFSKILKRIPGWGWGVSKVIFISPCLLPSMSKGTEPVPWTAKGDSSRQMGTEHHKYQ